ncbi:helix-turn-helix domain-containing protein [Clostridium tyrobutyricum]|uniref:helix-turn-helix transcriptional regulator n=1 Tax=Clostridium tyrobutyricum TaxID=1519 RepID=UPI001C38DAAE|nr:helix-turn-helix domain-containing protein [Clostridium tyrobutyricum]MBV4431516.1 helix-turn-helix domain-containing protein [Clostridium tyrobutyricum]
MIKNNLKKLRGDLNQKTVADSIGITQQQYSYIERSDRMPSLEVALKLSDFFKKPMEEIFFTFKDNKQLSDISQKEVV